MKRLLFVLLLAGCGEKDFPNSISDKNYSNGHPLSRNEIGSHAIPLEISIVDLTNEVRASKGLGPLSRSQYLDAIARGHSEHMFIHGFYDHHNPEGDGPEERLIKTAGRSGYIYENIWIVQSDATAKYIVDGFVASPGHLANILSATTHIGVGLYRDGATNSMYVTMEFLRE